MNQILKETMALLQSHRVLSNREANDLEVEATRRIRQWARRYALITDVTLFTSLGILYVLMDSESTVWIELLRVVALLVTAAASVCFFIFAGDWHDHWLDKDRARRTARFDEDLEILGTEQIKQFAEALANAPAPIRQIVSTWVATGHPLRLRDSACFQEALNVWNRDESEKSAHDALRRAASLASARTA